ncbi:hypothetical protein Poli38472_003945 [Pythium oligandrum]|uniref:Glucosidase 2 subunit beta n=1 Tax=Pythium oligandrum TaxID=41045 RepID=A0A8K1FJL2_PYTOL|nr:hypothetical protein Poli38472_003945 [Pythium oligandrum]|eukprot:TMW66180.1 hypothetical protein Poli38472_003945 [Pythium oligandrum]
MSADLPPHMLRRTMIKPTVGHVRRSSYDLPDARNPSHVYGLELPRDPENAGQVIGRWVHATPSPAAKCERSFIETNKQAIESGYITAGDARRYATEHPDILVKTPVKRKAGYTPTRDAVYGIRSKASEDITALVQARFTNFATENDDYPDLTSMKIKGKLPLPRETKTSTLKDVRVNPKPAERHHSELFKMSKFKNVGSMLSGELTVRGVAPADLEQYQRSGGLLCRIGDREELLPHDRVNDDYCDCDDGKDEPGTSACSNLAESTFYCVNGGFFSKQIPTSLLNDGICDCCDGSDEFDAAAGAASCSDTCPEEAFVYRQRAADHLGLVQRGYKKRQDVLRSTVSDYFSQGEDKKAATDKTLASLVLLKERVELHKAREERREKKMRLEVARQRQAEEGATEDAAVECKPGAENGDECENPGAKDDTAAESFDEVDTADVADASAASEDDTDSRRVSTMIQLSDGTRVSLAEYFRMEHAKPTKKKGSRSAEDMRRNDFLGPLFNGDEEGRKRIGIYTLRGIGLICSPVRLVIEAVLFFPRFFWDLFSASELVSPHLERLPSIPSITHSPTFRRLAGGSVNEAYKSTIWAGRVVWDAPIVAYNYLFPAVDPELTLPEAESLRKALREIEDDIAKLQKRRETQEADLKFDFGPDHAYYALKDQCIEKKVEKYDYKFCAFKDVRQDQLSLGNWEGYGKSTEDTTDHNVMRFTRGRKCWNGPERSANVQLVCGETNELVSVDEPSTCVYDIVVQTYLACTLAELESAQKEFAFWLQSS